MAAVKGTAPVKWWQTTTIYQVYPRSFKDSKGDGIGDLQGIISKLDYIRDLGFEAIWVSPFFASPQEDWGYDISDYCSIAPEYGGAEDIAELIEAVHARGMCGCSLPGDEPYLDLPPLVQRVAQQPQGDCIINFCSTKANKIA